MVPERRFAPLPVFCRIPGLAETNSILLTNTERRKEKDVF